MHSSVVAYSSKEATCGIWEHQRAEPFCECVLICVEFPFTSVCEDSGHYFYEVLIQARAPEPLR